MWTLADTKVLLSDPAYKLDGSGPTDGVVGGAGASSSSSKIWNDIFRKPRKGDGYRDIERRREIKRVGG